MIAKLKGTIDNIGEDCCIIDVNGVGYLVNMSSRSLSRLQQGEYTALLIETVIKEDSITLFGFQTPWEKEWFNTLTKIQGVGGKVCLGLGAQKTVALSGARRVGRVERVGQMQIAEQPPGIPVRGPAAGGGRHHADKICASHQSMAVRLLLRAAANTPLSLIHI